MPKISTLTELTEPQQLDLFAVVDVDEADVTIKTKKVTKENLLKNIESIDVKISNSLSAGSTVDYFNVDDGGNVRLNGEATTWTDMLVPLTQSKVGANLKPDFNYTEIAYEFPQNDITEYVTFTLQLPHSWKQGTTIYPHVHWKQTQNLTPVFKMDYKWFNIGDLVPATWSTHIMNNLAKSYLGGSLHQINDNPIGIDGIGKTISSMLLIKLYRDDNVYTGDVITYQFDIHYETDSFGSNIQYVKEG